MPLLQPEQNRAMIGSGAIIGVTIDTSVFDRFRTNLRHPTLRQLKRFAQPSFQLLISDVIIGEVEAHLVKSMSESQANMQRALTEHRRRWYGALDGDALGLSGDAKKEAQRQISDFIRDTGAKRLPLTGAGELAARAMEMYFASVPPFEVREKKKSEFPDALALLSIEALAERRGALILCVSADLGWKAFCEGSDSLIFVPDVETALSFFVESGRGRAIELWQDLRERGVSSQFYEPVRIAFRTRMLDLDFVADATSALPWSARAYREDFDSIIFSTASQPLVIYADTEILTFVIKVKARSSLWAEFTFSGTSDPNGDSVELANILCDAAKTAEYTLTISADLVDRGTQPVFHVSVDRPKLRADFGEIDPFGPTGL